LKEMAKESSLTIKQSTKLSADIQTTQSLSKDQKVDHRHE